MINQEALDKLRAAPFTSEKVIETLEAMDKIHSGLGGLGDTQLPIDYQSPSMEVEKGQMIPFIILGLRHPTIEEKKE